jgi:hypothetical protein
LEKESGGEIVKRQRVAAQDAGENKEGWRRSLKTEI